MPLLETSGQSFKRTLPYSTGDYVDIGTWSLTVGCASFYVSVTVANADFSASKQYFLSLSDSVGTSGTWTKAIPLSSTGSDGDEDFELGIRRTTNDVSMRLWRTGGTAVDVDADVVVRREGLGTDSFSGSQSSGTASVPTDLFSNSVISQTGGKVGIGKIPSTELLEVNGAIALGNASGTADGTLRWTGSDFEGRKASAWVSLTAAGGGGTPAGSDGQIQYNNGGAFGGAAQVYYDDANHRLGIGASAPRHRLEVIHPYASATQVRIGIDTNDSGGYLGSHNSTTIYITGGGYWSGAAWIAKATTSSMMYLGGGNLSFSGNSSLTVGNSFSPTARFNIYADGGVELLNGSSAAVSAGGTTRLRCSSGGVLQVSNNGGAYVDVSGAVAAGSDGQIQYNNGGAFGGAAQVYYDDTNHRLGIGASAPRHRLEVIHPLASPTQFHVGVDNADSGGYIGSHSSQNLYMISGGYFSGSAWVAKAAACSLLYMNAGTYSFYANSGLSAGSPFTPMQRMIIWEDGGIEFLNNSSAATGSGSTARLRVSSGILQVSNAGAAYANLLTSVIAAGSDTQVQYNSSGSLAGASGLIYISANSAIRIGSCFMVQPTSEPAFYTTNEDGTAAYLKGEDGSAFSTGKTGGDLILRAGKGGLGTGLNTAGGNGGDMILICANRGDFGGPGIGTHGSYGDLIVKNGVGTETNRISGTDGGFQFSNSDTATVSDAGSSKLRVTSGGILQLSNNTATYQNILLNLLEDTTPQLGGSLDVNGQSIVSVSNGNIPITPNGTGSVVLDGLNWPQADGSANQVLMTNGAAQLSWTTRLANIVEDTTPQLGGSLDVNGQSIVSVSNGNIPITPNGTGSVVLDGLNWPQADGSDGQVLKTNGAGQLSWLTVTTGTITGSGNAGKIPKWNTSTALTDSVITESSSNIGISQASPAAKLHVVGGIDPSSSAGQLRLESVNYSASRYWDIFANVSATGTPDHGLCFVKSAGTTPYLQIAADNSGTPETRFRTATTIFLDQGIQVGAPTGGDQGSGTINVSGDIYQNGAAYDFPDYVFEHFFTGGIEKFKTSVGASTYHGLFPLEEVRAFVRENYHLPNIPRYTMGIFERGDKSLEIIEELYLRIFDLQDQIEALKGKAK